MPATLLLAILSGAASAQPGPQFRASSAAVSSSTAAAPAPVPAAPEADSNVSVEKIVFAVDVSSKVPVGAADSFDASVGQVYCWNQLAIADPPVNIVHEWYWNDRKVAEVPILARYHRMRIWSKRSIRPGQWRVEIKDADNGHLISVGTFPVRGKAGS